MKITRKRLLRPILAIGQIPNRGRYGYLHRPLEPDEDAEKASITRNRKTQQMLRRFPVARRAVAEELAKSSTHRNQAASLRPTGVENQWRSIPLMQVARLPPRCDVSGCWKRLVGQSTAFCEMFVARDNGKFDFVASTADGRPVDVHVSKLRYWEFSATGESVAFKTELGGFDDKSPAGVARLLARLFREVGITSVASKGMKVKMTLQSTKTSKIPAADFKKLSLAAFEELVGAG